MGELVKVKFYGDQLWGYRNDDASVLIALKPIVDGMGLAWQGQLERLKRDPILSRGISVTLIPSVSGDQETVCLPLERIPGWLHKINANRVKPEIREQVIRFQEEVYDVLAAHFLSGGQRTVQLNEIVDLTKQHVDLTKQLHFKMDCLTDRFDALEAKRKDFSPEAQQIYIEVIEVFYDGRCPVDGETVIVQNGEKTALAALDHHYSRDHREIEHGWLVSRKANRQLENPKFYDSHLTTFNTFQENLRRYQKQKERRWREFQRLRNEEFDRQIPQGVMTTDEARRWQEPKQPKLL